MERERTVLRKANRNIVYTNKQCLLYAAKGNKFAFLYVKLDYLMQLVSKA